jgi:sensor histidine kinase YesM
MRKLLAIWKTISDFGTRQEFPEHFNRKIILSNRIATLAGIIVLLLSIPSLQDLSQFIPYLIGSTNCFLFVFLNYLGKVRFSRILLLLLVPFFAVVGSAFAPEVLRDSQKISLLSSITVPLVLFGITEKKLMVLGLAWTVICFIAIDYIDLFNQQAKSTSNLSASNLRVIEYVHAFVAFSLFIATYVYLQKLNINAEEKLEQLLRKSNIQKDEIEQQKKELEVANRALNIRALSAELNPHFLYNSLNSIQHFLSINDKTSSLNYLSKFGRLIRQFIDYSDKGVIPLSDELKLLKYYLELESLRFESVFRYDLQVEDDLLLFNIYVPLLLFQIHVENAILHGLINKQGDRCLKILFVKQAETMLCVIEDNGIGRAASARIRKAKGLDYRSRGVEISTQRLNLMYPSIEKDWLISIIDLYDLNHQPAGTRVEIRIPFEIM